MTPFSVCLAIITTKSLRQNAKKKNKTKKNNQKALEK